MSNAIRVLVVDDHPLFLDGVVHSLSANSEINVVGVAKNSGEAIRMTASLLPDILLIDITLPDVDGIETTRNISVTYPVVKVIILTASEDEDDLMRALKAGASGYIVKGVSAKELAGAILSVNRGESYITQNLASNLLLELSKPSLPDPLHELTERETQILKLVAQGLTNKEIGEQIHLSEKTIKHYMTNILQKLQVRSRVEAALIAQREMFKEDAE